uniref:Uncharacterized protein n=1 Tax=Rhizophora mucronata TaxID=61149 RepID=A0A2P2JND8_RHIMU
MERAQKWQIYLMLTI